MGIFSNIKANRFTMCESLFHEKKTLVLWLAKKLHLVVLVMIRCKESLYVREPTNSHQTTKKFGCRVEFD